MTIVTKWAPLGLGSLSWGSHLSEWLKWCVWNVKLSSYASKPAVRRKRVAVVVLALMLELMVQQTLALRCRFQLTDSAQGKETQAHGLRCIPEGKEENRKSHCWGGAKESPGCPGGVSQKRPRVLCCPGKVYTVTLWFLVNNAMVIRNTACLH